MRDRTVGDTFYMFFTTRAFATGVPTVLSGTPVVVAYEDASVTEITAGITLGVDHDGKVGLNLLTIVATGGNGYEAGKDYSLVITAGTVGGVSVIAEVVGEFSLSLDAAAVDLANATDGLGAIKGFVDDIGVSGVGLTNLPWNAAWDAEVESEVNDALVALKLDRLVAVAEADDPVDDSIMAKIASATGDWSLFVEATDSLQALRDVIAALNNVAATEIVTGGAIATTGGAVDVVTANTDMRGTDNAALAAVLGALADAAATGDPTTGKSIMMYLKQVVNVLAGSAGIATMPAEAAPANGVNMFEILRAMHADVTGLAGAAMRGTDAAALASVATEARLAELDAANLPSDLDAVLADTANMQPKLGTPTADLAADLAAVKAETALIVADTTILVADDIPGLIAALNDLSAPNVLTEINTALNAAIPELPVGVPATTPSIRTGIMLPYMRTRNEFETLTSGAPDTLEVKNNAGVTVAKKTITDAAGDYTEAKMVSG